MRGRATVGCDEFLVEFRGEMHEVLRFHHQGLEIHKGIG